MRIVRLGFLLGAAAVLGGCGALDPSIETTGLGASLLVTNGTAFDRATVDVGSHGTIVLPESAEVREGKASAGRLIILMRKEFGFAGHPPIAMSPSTARHYMGCAWRTVDGKLMVGTYGEWDSRIEGGARIGLTVLTPPGVKVEKHPRLSGEQSLAAPQGGSDPGLEALLWGYWYAPGQPAAGWRRVPSRPDLVSAMGK